MSRVRRYFTETVTLQPGESVVRSIRTAFVTCLDATGAFKIAIDDEGFSEFGQGLTLTLDTPSRQVWLQNASGDTNTLTLAYGEGGVRDQRLNVSAPVNVIDPFNVSLANDQVFAYDVAVTGASGEYSHLEIANPSGSGVDLTIVGLRIAVTATSFVTLESGSDGAPLSNSITPVATRITSGGITTGAASRMRWQRFVSKTSAAASKRLGEFALVEAAPMTRPLSFILEPDTSIRVYASDPNVGIELGAQWIEQAS